MTWRKALVLFVVPLFAALFGLSGRAPQAAEAASESSITVRVAASAAAVAQLNLQPQVALDYGAFQWLELSPADYAVLAASGLPATRIPHANRLQVVTYSFDPLVDGEPTLAAAQRSDTDGPALRLVQFRGPIQDAWLADMAASGLPALQYYPNNAFLTWGTAAQLTAVAASPAVRWHGALHPAYKVDPALHNRRGLIANVDVMIYNDGRLETTLADLAGLGATILQAYPSQPDKAFYNAILRLDAAAVDAVARLNTVLWLGYVSPEPILDDEMSSQIVAGNHPGGVPVTGYNAHLADLGFDGSGVVWAIIDTGIDYAHPDLNTHIVDGYTYPGAPGGSGPGDDCSAGGHGTHVAGIVGGNAAAGFTDANGFLYGLGIAPGVSFFASNSLCAPAWPPSGGWQEHSKRAVLGGAIGGNNSWTTGEGTRHGYQASERTHDIMVLDGNFDTTTVAEPFIEVFSAGNSGTSGLTAPKEGKNLIVTAASTNYRAGSIELIASFSSRGPAVDGRWVPTIAAPGATIASARRIAGASQCASAIGGTNNHYAFCSGTSMAAPHTAGAIALLSEWWRSLNGGATPSPAMAKALLVNGAVDMGTADVPNIDEGWGRINITNIISPSVPVIYEDQTTLFGNTGEQVQIVARVLDPSQPLRITLAWSDAPGAAGANPALVNNLNLTVLNGSTTYLGNVFSGGWSISGGSADSINNLENVFIQNPATNLLITIDAANIAGDAVLYNGDPTDQAYALVCSNCSLFPDFELSASPAAVNVCAPADALYDVTLNAVLGFSEPVTLAASSPAGTTASFSPNPVVPSGSSTLTVSETGSGAPGTYDIGITAMGPTQTHTTTVSLQLDTAVPAAAALLDPASGSAGTSLRPTFTWQAVPFTNEYTLEIAADVGFTNIVTAVSGLQNTSYTLPADLLPARIYFWRITGSNACGAGSSSKPAFFQTAPVVDSCDLGQQPLTLLADDFESGASGWTHGGSGDTWQLSGARPHGGASAFYAQNPSSVSDQYLISPPVALPAGQTPLTLQFWNWQQMESRTGGCYDGAVLELSADGGSWVRLDDELLTDPYNGPISGSYSNPLAGQDAWCGDPQDWLKSVVSLDAFGGSTVQLRFRLGTDSSNGREGWYVDDVAVQACVPAPVSLALSPDASSSAVAGNSVVHRVAVTNTGSLTETFQLTVVDGWGAALSTPTITLGAGENGTVEITVPVPAGAPVGASDVALVVAQAQSDASIQAVTQLTTIAVEGYALYLPALRTP